MDSPSKGKFTRARLLSVFGSVLSVGLVLVLLSGCLGGGGGGSTGPILLDPPIVGSLPAPGTSRLTNRGAVLHYKIDQTGSITFEIPTPRRDERFGLVVSNMGAPRSVTVSPISYVMASRQYYQKPSNIVAGLRGFVRERPINQIHAKRAIREGSPTVQDARMALSGVRGAVNNSGEVLGDEVTFSLWGGPGVYHQRRARLVKIGRFCKIFIETEDWQGLNAVTTTSDADLEHLVKEFDEVAWPIVESGYGPPYDIDSDGKVTILVSAMYQKLGFAGLFDSRHLRNDPRSNYRDMIAIMSPSNPGGSWTGEKWREAARETVAHEMQHLVNFSAKLFAKGVSEEVWLDEAMSVGIEARYRIVRGDNPIDDRFTRWASGSPVKFSLTQFAWNLSNYGIVGMFGHYIYEQGGSNAIRLIVQSGDLLGTANVDAVFPDRGGMNGIFRDWGVAVLTEGLREKGLAPVDMIGSRYKYSAFEAYERRSGDATRAISLNYNLLYYGQKYTATVKTYSTDFFVLQAPPGYEQSSFRFVVHTPLAAGTDNLVCTLIRY